MLSKEMFFDWVVHIHVEVYPGGGLNLLMGRNPVIEVLAAVPPPPKAARQKKDSLLFGAGRKAALK